MAELLGNIFWAGVTVATIGLLFAGCVEIYASIWDMVNKLRKGKK